VFINYNDIKHTSNFTRCFIIINNRENFVGMGVMGNNFSKRKKKVKIDFSFMK